MNFQLSEVGLTSKWGRILPAVQWCYQKQSNSITWCLMMSYKVIGCLQQWPIILFHTFIHHSFKTDSKLCIRTWKDLKVLGGNRQDLKGLRRTGKDMKEIERNWKAMKRHERPWKDLKGPGRTWKDLRGLGRTWQNWKELERIERSARSGKVWQTDRQKRDRRRSDWQCQNQRGMPL